MSASPVKAPVEVNFRATGVEGVTRGLRVVNGEANGLGVTSRRTGNSLNILAQSAAAGTGSLAGMAVAVGNVAEGMAAMSKSANIAASAAGIGVLIGALGVLIGLAIEAKKKLSETMDGTVSKAASAHLANLRTPEQIDEYLKLLENRRAGLLKKAGRGDEKSEKALANIDAEREAALNRRLAITDEIRARDLKGIQIAADAQRTELGKYHATLRAIEAERLESIRTHELTEEAANQRAADKQRNAFIEYRNFVRSENLRNITLSQSNASQDVIEKNAKENTRKDRFASIVGASIATLQTNLGRVFDEADDLIKRRTALIQARAEEIAGVFSSALQAGFSGGGFEGAGRAVLAGIGGIMVEIGEKALISMELIQTIAANLIKPAVGIPAAIALIALGTALQVAGNSSRGGGGGGGSYAGGYSGGNAQVIDRGTIGTSRAASSLSARTPVTANFTIIGPNDPNAVRGIDEILKRINQRGSLAGAR